jgi:GT2 family glycosyltransferase
MKLAPICLFTYNRLQETKQTIKALENNFLAKESELFIFSDGWKKEIEKNKILKVRAFLKTITGFKNVTLIESDKNKGLANSIIAGVTSILEKHENIIVLEDDLITAPNFLNFMNSSLTYYKKNDKIFSISGYTLDLSILQNLEKDVYLGVRASSWGWGTWRDRWINIDWEVRDYPDFEKSFIRKYKFNKGGSDMSRMLKNQMQGKIDSWAIKWCYHQFKKNQYTVFPKVSKLISIGFGVNATHTKTTKRFDTTSDTSNKVTFLFEENMILNKKVTQQFKNKFSVISRIKDKFN